MPHTSSQICPNPLNAQGECRGLGGADVPEQVHPLHQIQLSGVGHYPGGGHTCVRAGELRESLSLLLHLAVNLKQL